MSWKDLDIRLKAELIKLGVQSGIRDKNKIIQMYDLSIEYPTLIRKFEEGGFVNTELGNEQQVGLDRLIQDYLVQDPTIMFGIKTLEDSYRVSEALRKFELAKLNLLIEELGIIEKEVKEFIDKSTVADPIGIVRTVIQKGNLKDLNNPEIQKLLEQSSSIINSEEHTQQEKTIKDSTIILNEGKENPKSEIDYTEVPLIQMYLEYLKNKEEQGYDLHRMRSIAKENTEEYITKLKEKEEQLKRLREEVLKLMRIDSIQKAVLDSLIKELKPNTIQAQTSSNVEVPKETIQEVQNIIIPKYEKNTPEYYADSTAQHINRVLDEHFLQNPTLYSLLTDNFNFDEIENSFIHKEVNKEAFRRNTDSSYKDKRQPLEHLHRAIVIHTSGGKKQGDLTSLSGPYELIQTHYDVEDYYKLNFYKNLGFLKGIDGRKDLHGVEWKPPRGKVDIMPKQYAPIKNYLESYVFKKINNEHAFGGYINNKLPVLFRQFKNGGYKDNPPFVLRILNNDRRSVEDWQNSNYQSTHKLSYAQTPEGYIVYPEVQEVNGLLHDFTDPKYKHGKWDALDNAIRNNDTLRFSTELGALRYTQEYKQKYPEYFKLFNKGGYISNNPTLTLIGKVKKYDEGGYESGNEDENKNINNSILGRYIQSKISQNNLESLELPTIIIEEPASESTYVEQPPLNIQELELLNYLLSNPTTDQEYFRNLAIQNMAAPQSNLGVILTKEELDLIDKTFLRYNNFRYSHPWAEALNYTPIIGDGMDLISLAGAVNNKDYMTAGLGLGMLALPNFIEKPIKNYKKLTNRKNLFLTPYVQDGLFGDYNKKNELAAKIALKKYPDLSNPFDKHLAQLGSDEYKDLVNNKIEGILRNTLSLYKNLNNKDYGRLANIINLSPEYGIFLLLNPTLNPLSLNTLDKFFERLSLSIRGVTSLIDNDALVYLSTPPLHATGGDRLNTKGLYTSNSFDIADVFSRPLTFSLGSSYIGKLQYPFKIDKLQSFENLLKLYRSYIDHYYDLGLNSRIPGTIAKEATYVRGNGDHYYNISERSYYPKEKNNEKVVNILELQNRGLLQNLHGRWGNSNMIPNSEYFIPKYPNTSLSDYITFMKAATKEGKFKTSDPNEIKRYKELGLIRDLLTNLERKRFDLYIKSYESLRKTKKILDNVKSAVIAGTGAALISTPIIYAINLKDESPNTNEMSFEEFNEYYDLLEKVHKKTNIRWGKLERYSTETLQKLLTEDSNKLNGGFLFPNLAFSHKFEK